MYFRKIEKSKAVDFAQHEVKSNSDNYFLKYCRFVDVVNCYVYK